MKIAILGCGFIASTHAKVLNEMGILLSLCIDKDIETAKNFAAAWHVGSFSDDEDMVLDNSIDVVHICTPPNLHYETVKKCLEAGKHVFCEKPLCFDNGQAEELALLAVSKNLVNAVGFNVRYHMACQKILNYVKSGELGRIYLIHGSYLQEFHAFPAPLDWRYNKVFAGRMRAVTEIGSHWFDLAQYISGKKICSVSANFGNFNPERTLEDGCMYGRDADGPEKIAVESEDAAIIQLKFEDGAIGSTVLSEISQGRVNRLSLEITGENATVWWDSENNNLIHIGRKGEGVKTEILGFGSGFNDTERFLFSEVYKDIAAGGPSEEPNYPTFRDACQNVVLCNAVYESATNDSTWVHMRQTAFAPQEKTSDY